MRNKDDFVFNTNHFNSSSTLPAPDKASLEELQVLDVLEGGQEGGGTAAGVVEAQKYKADGDFG